ncbi:transposase [Chitinophaga sp. 30R24]|uniref:transposase n=1 Tax=Chitinophaga sp. 30R24 TaxID=3248838 RepID=UPI003B8EC989
MKTEDFLSDDFLAQIQKRDIEKMLEGELDSHWGMISMNTMKVLIAVMVIERRSSRPVTASLRLRFPKIVMPVLTPMIVPKREGMAQGQEEVIVSFYAKGMSVADIEEQIREMYKFDVSSATISRITSRVAEDIVAWQNRPLEPVYLIVWMDGIVFKVRENSKVINKTVYIAVGMKRGCLCCSNQTSCHGRSGRSGH